MNIKIQVGSKAFFSQYEDFLPTDNDYIEFHDDAEVDFWVTKENDEHIFHYRTMSKDEFINFELKHSVTMPMAATKFLVPELIEYFNLSFNELVLFNQYFEQLNKKHKYAALIYNDYLENGIFTLTEEQRLAAYEMYKSNQRQKRN